MGCLWDFPSLRGSLRGEGGRRRTILSAIHDGPCSSCRAQNAYSSVRSVERSSPRHSVRDRSATHALPRSLAPSLARSLPPCFAPSFARSPSFPTSLTYLTHAGAQHVHLRHQYVRLWHKQGGGGHCALVIRPSSHRQQVYPRYNQVCG